MSPSLHVFHYELICLLRIGFIPLGHGFSHERIYVTFVVYEVVLK
jgi:hypothetical protein